MTIWLGLKNGTLGDYFERLNIQSATAFVANLFNVTVIYDAQKELAKKG